MLVTHAYRFALDPTPRQVGALLAHAGAARVAHNWCLGQVTANLGQRAAERSYGVAEAESTPVFGWSLYSMRKAWNQVKGEVAPWWSGNSKEAYATGIDNLARALKNWSGSTKGKRKGPLQDRLERWPGRGRGPLVSQFEDVFRLWGSENQAAAADT